MGQLFNKAQREQMDRQMWDHLKLAAEAIQSKDRAKMNFEQAVLTGMLDLNVREPRHVRLVKTMISNLSAEIRKGNK